MITKELAITLFSNEGLTLPVNLKTKNSSNVTIPLDVTGAEFQSQIRKSEDNALAANIDVNIINATAGSIELVINSAIVVEIGKGRYVYDVMMQLPGAQPTVLWTASLTVRQGITEWQ